jgi:D-lactate dehydrogenase
MLCGVAVLENELYAKIKPGAIVNAVNPASRGIATVSGVVANDASGMTAGTTLNSYHNVVAMKVLLPSGTILHSADSEVNTRLLDSEPELHDGFLEIRDEIVRDESRAAWIRKKFAIKNTNGYRLDAILDHTTRGAILQRLMVGSEGTHGFIGEVASAFGVAPTDASCRW